MSQPPVVDDRTQAELHAEATELADQYIDQWDADSEDMASLLLAVGSTFSSELLGRVNRLPEKHRAAFLDTLGASPQPPQPAQLPLSVTVAADLDRNVPVPSGTQAVAETADDTTVFELPRGEGFEATPADLTAVYAADPNSDRLTTHDELADGESQQLFAGENHQQHALYLGDEAMFQLDQGAVLELTVSGSLDSAFDNRVVWEYYGLEADTEGWHQLAAAEAPTEDSIRGQIKPLAHRPEQSTDTESHTVRRQLPGEFSQKRIDGIESRWIRCRLREPTPASFETTVDTVEVAVGHTTDHGEDTPDAGFANDVPLALDGDDDIEPFGQFPQPSASVYLAADEALSKAGARVTLSFGPPETTVESATTATDDIQEADFGALSGPPEVSWEYWNGSGWVGLDPTADGTDGLQSPGDLEFVVPADVASTAVSGQEARWIRGRLVSGSYGQPAAGMIDPETEGPAAAPERPRYGEIELQYEHTNTTVAHVATENNGVIETETHTATDQFRPFRRLPEPSQTLYLGFDDTLREGPIPLFVPVAERSDPQGVDPGLRWEYCTDPETDSWSKLPVEDGTCGLTERGIVSVRFPEPTRPHERFGRQCHWLRAVVTEDSYDQPQPTADAANGAVADAAAAVVDAVNAVDAVDAVDVVDDSVDDSRSRLQPPEIEGLYPNTQWADNARTVENEILGSSDGSADQTFQCAHGPLIDCELWVDEHGALSASQRAALGETDPDRIETVTDDHGEPAACWVRWQPAAESNSDDSRRYWLDQSTGTIRFGDGDTGTIPPHGTDSIRVTYRTGGGTSGEVPAGAVTHLKTPISLVESVDNPLAAAGGADSESRTAVGKRVAGDIESRGRAVTASDYEQVAASAVRNLARVECLPNRGPDGERRPGTVSLVVVPAESRERPLPSMALQERITAAVSEVAPATVTAGDRPGIRVRGPTYAAVDVTTTVRAAGGESLSTLKSAIDARLSAFLHPLTGNNGEGWAFGERPTGEELRSQLREIDGVDSVAALSVTVRLPDEQRRLIDGPQPARLPVDGLVCSGSHAVSVAVSNR